MATKGVGPWMGPWPDDPRLDPDLLAHGDRRNVTDQYRYWTMDAIRADMATHAQGFEIAVENLDHDFNIGSIVRSANALGVNRVHIVGAHRWNRRGAMVTDRYLQVFAWDTVAAFAADCLRRGVRIVGIDNIPGSLPLEGRNAGLAAPNPAQASSIKTESHNLARAWSPEDGSVDCLVFGSEANGLSQQMIDTCENVYHITQYGSTRSMNVGHAAAIAMWAWRNARPRP